VSEQACFLKAIVAFSGNDDVVKGLNAKNFACFGKLAMDIHISFTRFQFAGRVVMDKNHRRCSVGDDISKDLPRMNRAFVPKKSFFVTLNLFQGLVYQKDAEKHRIGVTPAKAGVQKGQKKLDSCFRRNDISQVKKDFLNNLLNRRFPRSKSPPAWPESSACRFRLASYSPPPVSIRPRSPPQSAEKYRGEK